MTLLQELLSAQFSQLSFKFDYNLSKLTYFKIGGPAEVFVEVKTLADIAGLVKFCKTNQVKMTVLGGASNVIVSDGGIKGLVIKLKNDDIEIDLNKVVVGAGVRTSLLVKETLEHGLTGLEFFLGVPGTVGGAIFNNAHYLNVLIGKYVSRVMVMDSDGNSSWISQKDCEFDYDSSRFQTSQEVILAVEFNLEKGDPKLSSEKVKEATLYRAKTQPLGIPSSGCIFQNVKNTPHLQQIFPQFSENNMISAGFLIDQAGLKGTQVGDIQVSTKHAAFFVNLGSGSSKDIKKLINMVKTRVKEKFGLKLIEEVFWLE